MADDTCFAQKAPPFARGKGAVLSVSGEMVGMHLQCAFRTAALHQSRSRAALAQSKKP